MTMRGDPNEDIDWPVEWMPYALEALLYRRSDDVGTVLVSSICHYCGKKATTEDHIVPKALLPKPLSSLPYWFRSNDVVPACPDCNWMKSHFKSDCTCDHCTWAWKTAVGCGWVEPKEIEDLLVINIVRSPG